MQKCFIASSIGIFTLIQRQKKLAPENADPAALPPLLRSAKDRDAGLRNPKSAAETFRQ
jgi:hypothetical protein